MEILDKPKVIVGGAGAWQIDKTGSIKRLGVDCVINGRAEAVVLDLFQKAEAGSVHLPSPSLPS